MSIAHSHLKTAEALILSYPKGKPLVHHLKAFFATQKKYGSRDRKEISHFCYAYFRCASIFPQSMPIHEKIIYAIFFTQNTPSITLGVLNPELNEICSIAVDAKKEKLNLNSSHFFAFETMLSPSININQISNALLVQPSLFLRIRPGFHAQVKNKLTQHGLSPVFEDDVIRLDNGTHLENVLELDKEVVVQDANAQKVFDLLLKQKLSAELKVWDVCAASGGKSILLFDKFSGLVKLAVTDIRNGILSNLKTRLQKSKIPIQKLLVADLTKSSGLPESERFDIIIADVPCTGSGTWGRTPEQHFSFESNSISSFQQTQRKIVENSIPHLNHGGFLVYATCSVFSAENEDQTAYFQQHFGLELIGENYYDGSVMEADTLFSAVFKKP